MFWKKKEQIKSLNLQLKFYKTLNVLHKRLNHLALAILAIIPLAGFYRYKQAKHIAKVDDTVSEAIKLEGQKKCKEAFEKLSQAAAQGSVASAVKAAEYTLWDYSKEGIPQDQKKGLETLEKLSKQGVVQAQAKLGRYYLENEDYAKAYPLLKQAALQGNTKAQIDLGFLYYKNEKPHPQLAIYWTRKAMNVEKDAKYNFAVFLLKGFGMPKDEAQGQKILLELANEGLACAQLAVALNYEDGKYGFIKSEAEARKWYERAKDSNNVRLAKEASDQLARLDAAAAVVAVEQAKAKTQAEVKAKADTVAQDPGCIVM